MISNIDNINVDYDIETEKQSVYITEELPDIEYGIGFFPSPMIDMRIEFEVFIPVRIQSELSQRMPFSLGRTFTEKFKISIIYLHDLPVTFVELLNPSKEPVPSVGVILVREFLKDQFENVKSDYIQFERLGPSPFHADCYIYPLRETDGKNEVNWKVKSEIFSQKGYDRIVFYFNPTQFKDAEEAKEEIFYEIRDELAFYYSIVQSENYNMKSWIEIENLIDQLISIQRAKHFRGFFKRLFSRSKLIDEALTSLVEFESEELWFKNSLQKRYRGLFSMGSVCFQGYIDRELKNRTVYPVKEITRLIDFFESRREKTIESLVVLIAAILGGAVGALLTISLLRDLLTK